MRMSALLSGQLRKAVFSLTPVFGADHPSKGKMMIKAFMTGEECPIIEAKISEDIKKGI